jgi:hypothetical protein
MKFVETLFAILPAIVLASCSSVSTQAPTVATISEVAVTLVPTATPLPTETLMPTIDPNAPAEYSRFENNVYFLDKTTKGGNTLTYLWDKQRKSWYRIIFTGFVLDRPKEYGSDYPDALLMNIYIDDSIVGEESIPMLKHSENTDPPNTVNFYSRFQTNIINALVQRGVIKNISEFNKPSFDDNKFYFDFINADGSQRWGIWPGTTIEVHIRGDYDTLKMNMGTNGFSETKSLPYGYTNNYMLKVWTDETNSLYVDIAPSLPAVEWTEAMFYEMAFLGPGLVFESSDLTNPVWTGSKTSEFVLNRETWAYFEFGPPP